MNRIWSHGGSAGDIICHLTPMKDIWKQEGIKSELYINSKCHVDWRMPEDKTRSLLTLIDVQPYIEKTGLVDKYVGTDLDTLFRYPWMNGMNLSDIIHTRLKMPHTSRTDPWLLNVDPWRVAKVVIHRSPRYHVGGFPWDAIVEKYGKDAIFAGHWSEHADFVHKFGFVPFYRTPTFLDLAKIIAGSLLFIGNQSSPAAIAQGLRHTMIHEAVDRYHWAWNTHWDRPGIWYDGNYLPDLDSLEKNP